MYANHVYFVKINLFFFSLSKSRHLQTYTSTSTIKIRRNAVIKVELELEFLLFGHRDLVSHNLPRHVIVKMEDVLGLLLFLRSTNKHK